MPWFRPAPVIGEPLPVQVMTLRRLDRLPSFSAVIQDDQGTALDVTGYTAFMRLRNVSPEGCDCDELTAMPLTIEPGATGLVTYDFQLSETTAAAAGVYDVTIELIDSSGNVTTAPAADGGALIKIRPEVSSGYLARDADGAFVIDGNGYATPA